MNCLNTLHVSHLRFPFENFTMNLSDNSALYWVIGILITINLGLMGGAVVLVGAKADATTVTRFQQDVDEIQRRDRDYLVRSQIEDIVRTQAPYASDKPKIDDRLDKLEVDVKRNETDIRDTTSSLVRIETQVAQIQDTLRKLDGKIDELTEALARTGALSSGE